MSEVKKNTKRSSAESAKEAREKSCSLVRTRLMVNVLQMVFHGEFTDAAVDSDFLIGEAMED